MWQEKQAKLLRQEIAALLAPLTVSGSFCDAIQDSLKYIQQEASLGGKAERPWTLLPAIVCESICGQGERAIPASASIALLRAALEVFDDIEDADNPVSISAKYGGAVASNIATALLFLAETALARLKLIGVPDNDVVRVMEKVNSYHLTACAGQHWDIAFSNDTAISEELYLRMIEMKAAFQLECSCHIGALLGNGSRELVELFSKFGRCLGMAAQIANDVQGTVSGKDVARRKITLPVIFAFGQANIETRRQLKRIYRGSKEVTTSSDKVKCILFETGAMQYAAIKMETYRQEAREMLWRAEAKGVSMERLKPFLD